jgi:spore germination protein YaaH
MHTHGRRLVALALALALGDQKVFGAPPQSSKPILLASQHRAAGTSIPQELQTNAQMVDIVAPMWFDANDQGAIAPASGCSGPYTGYAEFCHANRIQLMPIVRNFAPRPLLSNPEAVKRCAQEIAALTHREGFDGIVIDIEQVQPDLQGSLMNLMRDLYPRMQKQGQRVCIAVNARAWGKWDYWNLALNSDWLYVMFYDYTGPWNKHLIGPTAPINWTEQAEDIQRDLQSILATGTSREKLLFGVPLYGNDFTLDPKGGALSATTLYVDDLLELKQEQHTERRWDDSKKSPFFEYHDGMGAAHQAWYEDAESYSNKFQLALQNHLGGIAFWALRGTAANVNSGFWATVKKQIGDKQQ